MANTPDCDFVARLPAWNRFFETYRPPPVLHDEYPLRELKLRCVNLRRRLRDGPMAPLRLAFFGPTGAGKSKLFSSLTCRIVSASGFRRPFTTQSCYFVHEDWKPIVAAMQGRVELHDEASWHDIVLVDTPDFDSVELANRDEAERVFLESDGFLFVTDALKYADASTWEYLTKIQRADKRFAVVLNKVSSDVIPESFDAIFRETFSMVADQPVPYEKTIVPELPLRDEDLIEPGHQAHQALCAVARRMAGEDPAGQSMERYRGELEAIFRRSTQLLDELQERQGQLRALRRRLAERFESTADRLRSRMAHAVDPSTRDQVFEGMLKKINEYDMLRYPRKIIAMPIQGVYSLVKKYRFGGVFNAFDDASDPVDTADPLTTETFHLVESELIRFADETRLDLRDQPGLQRLVDRDQWKKLQLEHTEIKRLFREHDEGFRSWVAEHARMTADQITTEHKAKFFLSQLLYNGVVISTQVATGGGFSLWELGFDGVVSPFVAKGIGMVLGHEKVREFEADAQTRLHDSLRNILARGRDRFVDFIDQATEGLDELETHLAQIGAWQPELQKLTDAFAAGIAMPTTRPDVSDTEGGRDSDHA